MYVKSFSGLVAAALLLAFFTASSASNLPENEVAALQKIARALGKADWNFSVDPCSGASGWHVNDDNRVFCDCASSNSDVCHVTNITLKKQNLPGQLPPEMADLRYLVHIDLTRNYLNGSIPDEWRTLKLLNASLLGNRLTGKIPPWIGNMTTLRVLVLEANYFTGPIPPEFGNLTNLQKTQLGSNMFSGALPKELAKLSNMEDFRISDNQLTGQIPELIIQNWTKLTRLEMQASGLQGPIPSEIFRPLKKLDTLRISDMSGNMTSLHLHDQIRNMTELTLRKCGLSGKISDYIGISITYKKYLDLSFNQLSGEIPSSASDVLKKVKYLYLNRNNLVGPVPDWAMDDKAKNIDLSFNNLTWPDPSQSCGEDKRTNLVGNFNNVSKNQITPCLYEIQCTRLHHSLYINCGGHTSVKNGSKTFEADGDSGGPSQFFLSPGRNWAYSITGAFVDNNNDRDIYVKSAPPGVQDIRYSTGDDKDLYKSARISPVSLVYFGLCLINNNYTVKLHFAEIVISNDLGYASLGRRVFNVYIQGELVVENFNIRERANGSYAAAMIQHNATVTNNTLEIQLYWTGKGTQSLPDRGTYGPLISAISVEPNFKVHGGLSTKIVVAIVLSGSCLIIIITIALVSLWKKGCFGLNTTNEYDLRGVDLQTNVFTLRQIKLATEDFNISNKIGEGGFGPVYKGLLPDGTMVAVKQLSSKSKQGNREFLNELGMISALQHPNLVKLYGCCIEGNQLLLVYEYMENNSLARALFGPKEFELSMDWSTRQKICVGIAKGLAYLHEESRLKVVHRDIKATNVLLDKDLNPKISDFGLARLNEEDNSHISTKLAGTIGYMAPEYTTRGYLTEKADVYSFGILSLEIITGKRVLGNQRDGDMPLLDWVNVMKKAGTLEELVDKRLERNFDREEAMRMINVGLVCVDPSPTCRPAMSAVVRVLNAEESVTDVASQQSILSEDSTIVQEQGSDQSQMSRSIHDETIVDVTTSTSDLYPIIQDSQY